MFSLQRKRPCESRMSSTTVQKKDASALTVASENTMDTSIPEEYAPFILLGTVSLLGSSVNTTRY